MFILTDRLAMENSLLKHLRSGYCILPKAFFKKDYVFKQLIYHYDKTYSYCQVNS